MTCGAAIRPMNVKDLQDAITEAARVGEQLEIRGGASKAGVGAPRSAARVLDMSGFSDAVDYDPAELVLTVGAGAPLQAVRAMVEAEGQVLPFDPVDPGPIYGQAAGAATLGGVLAAGLGGSLRLTQGAPRDHLLGFEAVSGRGEHFVAGGKVVKNVTGYDLSKLMAGSWGRLAALTEVTLKVLPRPRMRTTKLAIGLGPREAVAMMARALGSQAEVSAAAYRPAAAGSPSLTALRLQGFAASVDARCAMLDALFEDQGRFERLDTASCENFWSEFATLGSLAGERPLWRINVPPSRGAGLAEALAAAGGAYLLDWAGALVWTAFDGDPNWVRSLAETSGGHAMLVRGPDLLRAAVPAFHPPAPGVAALEMRIRRAFDPHGVFETGRF